MERVFSVEAISSSTLTTRLKAGSSGYQSGRVEKILEPGLLVVTLEDGRKIEVRSAEALRVGSRVKVFFPPDTRKEAENDPDVQSVKLGQEVASQWSAFIPLGFGGKNAKARLEVFTERRPSANREKAITASYFVFTVTTEKNGEVQWSVHLRGHQVALQVYSPDGNRESLSVLMNGIEKTLKSQGFVFSAPVTFLGRPFRAPAGFRLNVRG